MEHIKAEILKHVEHAVIHNFKKIEYATIKTAMSHTHDELVVCWFSWLIFLILSRSDVYVKLINLLKKNIHFFFGFV